jgi:CHASE3 domain sensor protein
MEGMNVRPAGTLQEYKHGILRELGMPALFVAGVLLLSATLLLGVNIAAMRNNLAWIGGTQQILLNVAEAENGVVGDQLTVRGYALTGDARFLLFQRSERARLKRAMARLTQLTAPDPAGADRIALIGRLIKRHTDYCRSISGLGPEHADIVAKAINDDRKRAILFQTRGALAAYRADEIRALAEKQDYLTRQLSQSFYLAVGILVAAFLLGGLGLVAAQLRLPFHRHLPRG